jgi:mannose-6-phosphate isomerase-like protein (cupin superfamily)
MILSLQIFNTMEGAGVLRFGEALETYPVKPGDVVRIPLHTRQRIQCEVPGFCAT